MFRARAIYNYYNNFFINIITLWAAYNKALKHRRQVKLGFPKNRCYCFRKKWKKNPAERISYKQMLLLQEVKKEEKTTAKQNSRSWKREWRY